MRKKSEAVFCKVRLIDGTKKTYRFPNDLQDAMFESYLYGELKDIMVGALINLPVKEKIIRSRSKHSKPRYVPTLSVAKIENVFVSSNCKVKRRTRGQFLTEEHWRGPKPDLKFLLHDHSFANKLRIAFAFFSWKYLN